MSLVIYDREYRVQPIFPAYRGTNRENLFHGNLPYRKGQKGRRSKSKSSGRRPDFVNPKFTGSPVGVDDDTPHVGVVVSMPSGGLPTGRSSSETAGSNPPPGAMHFSGTMRSVELGLIPRQETPINFVLDQEPPGYDCCLSDVCLTELSTDRGHQGDLSNSAHNPLQYYDKAGDVFGFIPGEGVGMNISIWL